MRAPTIHSNGDCYDDLYNPVVEATLAIKEAINAVTKMRPHGRNYYVQGTATGPDPSCEAYEQWRQEFVLPLKAMEENLQSLRREIYKQRKDAPEWVETPPDMTAYQAIEALQMEMCLAYMGLDTFVDPLISNRDEMFRIMSEIKKAYIKERKEKANG